MTTYRQLLLGEPAPWFHQRNTSNPRYAFDTVAGRYIVLCFFATAEDAVGQAALALVDAHYAMFDETRFAFFGVSNDPADEHSGRVVQRIPGVRHFWDFDGKVARLYGALPEGTDTRLTSVRRQWVVLDPALQVVGVLHFRPDGTDRDTLLAFLRGLPPVSHYGGVEMHAPVILQPHVFEPALCAHLIRLYEADGGEESGFMRDEAGKTVGVYDHGHKSRQDLVLSDTALCRQLQQRIFRKVVPTILRVHSFAATRMERYLVGCYDSARGGHFRPHRDNTTLGTAHRRFAVSINLNADFDGGELVFPEYGPRRFKLPPGAALVFSGALLHMVTPVTRGRRFAFLPFLYDEAAAALRERNSPHLAEGGGQYRA
jgi:predicted 2-oxoglutarate/Fe(II)-dependent dioxygenase YbiX/peroxiredoxin